MKHCSQWIISGLVGIMIMAMGAGMVSAQDPREHPKNAVIMTWYNGQYKQRIIMALDEVAIFLDTPSEKSLRTDEKEALRQQYHPQATMIEDHTLLSQNKLLLKRPDMVAKEQVSAHLKALKHLPNVRQVSPVFYITPNRDPRGRMVLTGRIIVGFSSVHTQEQIHQIEQEYELVRVDFFNFANTGVYQMDDTLDALELANRLHESGRVLYAHPSWAGGVELDGTLPTDSLFHDQWNFLNTGQLGGPPGEDIKITNAWDTSNGDGVVIAVVDMGLELTHADLKERVIAGESWDYIDDNNDPAPDPALSNPGHGTAVAGLAVATWNNHTGISGTAPAARLVGYRLNPTIPEDLANAFSRNTPLISIYNNSWGMLLTELMLQPMQDSPKNALTQAITQGRGGLGNIFVFSGGNSATDGDNSNYDGYKNSRYTIAVAASNYRGETAVYSEKGANLLVNAPSSNTIAPFSTLGVPTTDLTDTAGYNQAFSSMGGDYYTNFGGTSAAAP